MASKVTLPAHPSYAPPDRCHTKNGYLPPLLVINIQFPYIQGPSMFSSDATPGASLVMYLQIKEETLAALEAADPSSADSDEALKLLVAFLAAAPEDPTMKARLKSIMLASNADQINFGMLSSAVNQYNAKPVLVVKNAEYFKDEDAGYVEIDCNLGGFSYLARQGMWNCMQYVPEIDFRVGFVVQGETDVELPERVMCAVELHMADLAKLVDLA